MILLISGRHFSMKCVPGRAMRVPEPPGNQRGEEAMPARRSVSRRWEIRTCDFHGVPERTA